MHGRRRRFSVFIIFLFFAFFLFVLSQRGWLHGLTGVFQIITLPLQRTSFRAFHRSDSTELTRLSNENRILQTQLVKLQALEKDNQALRDQFAQTVLPSPNLLPASLVGIPNFLPGVSLVDSIIIDKGSDDKVKIGSSVVYQDVLLGKVVRTSAHLSQVDLLSHKDISFTAVTSQTSALGIIQGVGGGAIVFNNVLLSDNLRVNDMIVTKGDVTATGTGFPSHLVVGKIVSVNKKASALFQSAEVSRLVDPTRIDMVFVVLGF